MNAWSEVVWVRLAVKCWMFARRKEKLKEPHAEVFFFFVAVMFQENLSFSKLEARSGTYSLNTVVLPFLCLKSVPQILNSFIQLGLLFLSQSCISSTYRMWKITWQECHLLPYYWPFWSSGCGLFGMFLGQSLLSRNQRAKQIEAGCNSQLL